VVGLFVATWILALLVWRIGRVEECWNAHLVEPTKGLG
jgi:high-affinity nickel-transport protein